jgi:hypothetical protein
MTRWLMIDRFDLVISNGTVLETSRRYRVAVGMRDGTIAGVAPEDAHGSACGSARPANRPTVRLDRLRAQADGRRAR